MIEKILTGMLRVKTNKHIWGGEIFNTLFKQITIEQVNEISNNVVYGTSKASDQPAHTRSQIRALASRLSILWLLSY